MNINYVLQYFRIACMLPYIFKVYDLLAGKLDRVAGPLTVCNEEIVVFYLLCRIYILQF